MKRFFLPLTALAAAASVGLGTVPVQAHGMAAGGPLTGFLHPLLGADHLLMLLAVGTAASQLSLQLLLWALGGGVIGALGSSGGWTLPLLESLAALAIVAVAALTLVWNRRGSADRAIQLLTGGVVGAGVGIHGLLHGLEAPTDGSALMWWGGALLSSLVVCGGTALVLRQVPQTWRKALALAMLMAGGVLVFAS
jgi:urease accessory protein